MNGSLLRRSVLVLAIGAMLALVQADAEAAKAKSAPPTLAERVESLKKDASALSARDAQRVAPKALERARSWAGEALAAAKKGDSEKAERALLRARLQVDLAHELIALATLRRRVASLEGKLAAIRSRVEKRKAKLGERDEYLNLLKVTRQ